MVLFLFDYGTPPPRPGSPSVAQLKDHFGSLVERARNFRSEGLPAATSLLCPEEASTIAGATVP